MDEHKVPIEELYERLGTDPNTVRFWYRWKNLDFTLVFLRILL
jgi:hypothetical protein